MTPYRKGRRGRRPLQDRFSAVPNTAGKGKTIRGIGGDGTIQIRIIAPVMDGGELS